MRGNARWRACSITILYPILGSAVALAFLGHGILGAKGQESFVELVDGHLRRAARWFDERRHGHDVGQHHRLARHRVQ
jgi:hypothetical protein